MMNNFKLSILLLVIIEQICASPLVKRQYVDVSLQNLQLSRDQSSSPQLTILNKASCCTQNTLKINVEQNYQLVVGILNYEDSDQTIKSVTTDLFLSRWSNNLGDIANLKISSERVVNINLVANTLNNFTLNTPFKYRLKVSAKEVDCNLLNQSVTQYSLTQSQNVSRAHFNSNQGSLINLYANSIRDNCNIIEIDQNTYVDYLRSPQLNQSIFKYVSTVSVNAFLDVIGIQPKFEGYFEMKCK